MMTIKVDVHSRCALVERLLQPTAFWPLSPSLWKPRPPLFSQCENWMNYKARYDHFRKAAVDKPGMYTVCAKAPLNGSDCLQRMLRQPS